MGDPNHDALASALQGLIGRAAQESAQTARERFDSTAERVTAAATERSESDRAHLEDTLGRAVTELKQELSRAVLSLTKSLATSHQQLAQLETSVSERISAITTRLDLIERAVAARSDTTAKIDGSFAALASQLSTTHERVGGVMKRIEAVDARIGETFAIEPRVAAIEPRMSAIEERLTDAPSAIRALEQKLETMEALQRELAASMRGRGRFGFVAGALILLSIAGAIGAVLVLR
jgi:chromosome segregation ATPase